MWFIDAPAVCSFFCPTSPFFRLVSIDASNTIDGSSQLAHLHRPQPPGAVHGETSGSSLFYVSFVWANEYNYRQSLCRWHYESLFANTRYRI